MNFLSRDIVAILMGVCLIRMAWNDDNENSFTASFRLAFYTHGRVFSPLDIDGDGTTESLAVVVADGEDSNSGNWRLEILDLKSLHTASSTAAPFRPETMLQAPTITTGSAQYPIKMVTGQIMIRHPTQSGKKKKKVTVTENAEYTDRTRHYFCGSDWHDAAKKCGTPCPGGTPGECPDSETCYADTPCDAMSLETTTSEEDSEYQLTPAGGLPSVVSLWSDGMVRLHAVTKDDTIRRKNNLVLKELWAESIGLQNEVGQLELTFLGDVDLSSSSEDGKYGVVVVGGINKGYGDLLIALDVLTGKIIWSHVLNLDSWLELEQKPEKERGFSSVARRRSRLLNDDDTAERTSPNCWSMYKHSLLDFLPYTYWGPADGKIEAVHLDHRLQRRHRKNHRNKRKNSKGDSNQPKQRKSWHSRHAPKPVRGRPNVLLSRVDGGLKVRSLKNGRSICHLSLLDHVIYADINHDGTLDQIQALTTSKNFFRQKSFGDGENDRWIHQLQNQILGAEREKQQNPRKNDNARERRFPKGTGLCHIMALSGIPAREELYSASLCDSNRDFTNKNLVELSAAPPLLVAPNHDEVIIALSNGAVSKHVAATGQKIWQGRRHDNPPTWGPNSQLAAVKQIIPSVRNSPILIMGETSMSMRSPQGGSLLDSTDYPTTPALQRPTLHQLDDQNNLSVVLVATPDAVWAYVVELQTSTTLVFRFMVGFLFVFIAIALLRNKYMGGGRRSTDA